MWIKFLYLCIFLSLTFGVLAFLTFRKSRAFFIRLTALLKCLIFTMLALSLIWAVVNLRKYEAFGRERLIARIMCRKIGNEEMELVLQPQNRGGREKIFILRGEQWMLGGEILSWKRPFYLFGFNSLYKLTRVSSRYLKAERESLATHFELNNGTDSFWLFLYRNQRLFPFVEAVYGNAAYTFPKHNTIFKLYVNQTGYFIREER